MAIKQLLCTALSRRDGGNCFAGIELRTGLWIRPINGSSVGQLYDHQCLARTTDGVLRYPTVLDLVEIDLLAPSPSLAQPENWLIGEESWRIVGRGSISDIAKFTHNDPELFRGYDRFVSALDVQARPPHESLLLVRPELLKWSVEPHHYRKFQVKGTFSVCGQSYTLPLTDIVYEARFASVPAHSILQQDLSIPIALTISLVSFGRSRIGTTN